MWENVCGRSQFVALWNRKCVVNPFIHVCLNCWLMCKEPLGSNIKISYSDWSSQAKLWSTLWADQYVGSVLSSDVAGTVRVTSAYLTRERIINRQISPPWALIVISPDTVGLITPWTCRSYLRSLQATQKLKEVSFNVALEHWTDYDYLLSSY